MKNLTTNSYIYLVKCGNACKLGYSVLPEQRINLIKSDNSKPVKVLGVWEHPNAYEVEQDILNFLYNDKDNDGIEHIRGEWFKIPSKALNELIRILSE